MSTRLINTNAVSQQNSPIIVVVRDIKDRQDNSIVLQNDPNEDTSNHFENDEQNSPDPLHEDITYLESKDDENESGLVWSRNRSTEFDNNATEYFLQVRGSEKYRTLFRSKKFGRSKLWAQIAQEMNSAGYYVGEGREAAERCRQKFSNLEKSILNYMKHISIPGNKKREPPQFYELMSNLVDYESKLYKNQNSIIDSVRDNLEIEIVTPQNEECFSSKESLDRDYINVDSLGTSTDNLKKNKQKNDIMALLTKQHAEIIKLQRDYLDKLDKHLAIQNEQRERMINCFIEAMNENPCKCKGRKRRASSMDSD